MKILKRPKSVLIFITLFYSLNTFCQKTADEKALWGAGGYKSLEQALKHPEKTKRVAIMHYTDSIFPNEQLLKLKNIEHILIWGLPEIRKKKDSLLVPIIFRVDTARMNQLTKLKYLEFVVCDFRKFPVGLCYLRNLKGLSITGCLVDSLPEEIGHMENLRALTMRINNLKWLPKSLSKLDSLSVLDLTNNLLKEFPKVLPSIKNLQKIYLSNDESYQEIKSSGRGWQYPIHINRINYSLSDVELLKTVLMNPKLKRIYLHSDYENQNFIEKRINSKELLSKIKWRKPALPK